MQFPLRLYTLKPAISLHIVGGKRPRTRRPDIFTGFKPEGQSGEHSTPKQPHLTSYKTPDVCVLRVMD